MLFLHVKLCLTLLACRWIFCCCCQFVVTAYNYETFFKIILLLKNNFHGLSKCEKWMHNVNINCSMLLIFAISEQRTVLGVHRCQGWILFRYYGAVSVVVVLYQIHTCVSYWTKNVKCQNTFFTLNFFGFYSRMF